MAARQVIVPGAMPSRDANGRALPAKLRFYEVDTALTTQAIVYTASDLVTPHDFPILSDSAGRWPQIWCDASDTFDVSWTDLASDALIDQFSDITPLDDGVLASVELSEDAADRAEAAARQVEAIVADLSGAPFTATSSTSNTIGTGTKTFTLNQTGRLISEGQPLVASVDGQADNQMTGICMSAVENGGGYLVIDILVSSHLEPDGVGPYTAWNIGLSSLGGVVSVAGLTGAVMAADLRTAMDVFSTAETKAFALACAVSL